MLLLINGRAQEDVDAQIRAALKQHVKTYQEKSRSVSGGNLDLVIELRIKDGTGLTAALSQIPGVDSVTLMRHDGEVTY